MKTKPRIGRIMWRTLLRKNYGTRMLALVLLLMTAMPVVLYGSSQLLLDQVAESKKMVYGEFSDIFYGSSKPQTAQEMVDKPSILGLLPLIDYSQSGFFITTMEEQLGDDVTLRVGYGSQEALDLGRITLEEGRWCEQDNEVVLTRGLATFWDNVPLGGQVTMEGRQYTVSGIVGDYGRIWPRGNKQNEEGIGLVNAFVTGDAVQSMFRSAATVKYQVLLVRNEDNSSTPPASSDDLYYNHNGAMGTEAVLFRVPPIFLYILLVMTALIVYGILLLYQRRALIRGQIYHQLGMQWQDIFRVLWGEKVIAGLVAIIAGGALGRLLIPIVLRLGTGRNITGDSLGIGLLFSGKIVFLLSIMTVLVTFLQTYVMLRSARKELALGHKKVIKLKKTSTFLVFFEFLGHKSLVVFLATVFAAGFLLLGLSGVYQSAFKIDTQHRDFPGYMSDNFDFEFKTIEENGPPYQGDDDLYLIASSFEIDGMDDQVLEQLRQEKGVQQVQAFRENNKLFMHLSPTRIDDFLDASDFHFDGSFHSRDIYNPAVMTYFNYNTDDLMAETGVTSYPREVLESFVAQVSAGKINYEKLKSGEEIILLVPSFTLSEVVVDESSGSMGIMYDPYPEDLSQAYKNTLLKVGDDIHLSGLFSEKRFNGAVYPQDVKDYYKRMDIKTKIGAIITVPVGRFDGRTAHIVYDILTANEAFDSWQLPGKYMNVRVSSDGTLDAEVMSAAMKSYLPQVPYMRLTDYQGDMQNYHYMNAMIDLFSTTIVVMVILAVYISVASQFYAKTRLNMQRYGFLRINGLSLSRIKKFWVFQMLTVYLVGLGISIPVFLYLLSSTWSIGLADISLYFTWQTGISIVILNLVVAALALCPSFFYLRKHIDNVLTDL